MRGPTRMKLWSGSAVVVYALDALAVSGGQFIFQPVQMPLWAVLAAVMLPGEAFADLSRSMVKRIDPNANKQSNKKSE